jgi:hypothetical protein
MLLHLHLQLVVAKKPHLKGGTSGETQFLFLGNSLWTRVCSG